MVFWRFLCPAFFLLVITVSVPQYSIHFWLDVDRGREDVRMRRWRYMTASYIGNAT